MVDYPLTAGDETLTESEKERQKKTYFLDPLPGASTDETRRDRLAHLMLVGLKAARKNRTEESEV